MATNYYLGLRRGLDNNIGNVVAGTSSNGTSSDIELRMQIDPGTGATGLTRKDVNEALQVFLEFINSGGPDGGGGNLPAI
jgi:hypothetical protein